MMATSNRSSYRHRLNMPVRYSFTDEEGEVFEGVGVTTDLNELGLGAEHAQQVADALRGNT